ncbi:MAG: ribose-5-phosphate isomerase RpiA [Melioribacteraceae bacterium]|nr:ribose-5-phosphate isomerase RpiA [Melioribacteraceae bacterium]
MKTIDTLKKLAAEKAVDEIKSGMIIGLGTGSTFKYALLKLAELIKKGSLENIVGIPSSLDTENKARELGIPLTTLNEAYNNSSLITFTRQGRASSPLVIDITIDGADEVAVNQSEGKKVINLIKGGGGALLREKVLTQASNKLIIAVDESKVSGKLGTNFSVPVEVLQYSFEAEIKYLESLGAVISLRKNNDKLFMTDEGNYIIDAKFNGIDDCSELSAKLNDRAGVVGHGIFVGLASKVFIAKESGIEVLEF